MTQRNHNNVAIGSPFRVDWTNLDAVISYAKQLGPGMTVFKHPARDNYNITHSSRMDRYPDSWVVFQTQ